MKIDPAYPEKRDEKELHDFIHGAGTKLAPISAEQAYVKATLEAKSKSIGKKIKFEWDNSETSASAKAADIIDQEEIFASARGEKHLQISHNISRMKKRKEGGSISPLFLRLIL